MHHRKTFLAAAFAISLPALYAPARADDGPGTQREIGDLIPEHHESTGAAASRNWAVLPEAGYTPDQKLNGGFKFTGRRLGERDLTVDAEFNAALGRQLGADATLVAPGFLDARGIGLGEYHYYLSPDKPFFGLGNNHVRSPLSVHSLERQRALFTYGWHLTDDLVVAVTAGTRQTRISRSPESGKSYPATADVFPRLTGLAGGRTNPVIASFIYNDRTSVTRPTRGWSVLGAAEHVNANLSNDFAFTRYTLDASYLHPLESDERVFGLRLGGEYVDGAGGHIPFFELASLGGSDDMRGFFPDRFLGTSRVTVNVEYRDRLGGFRFMNLWDVQVDGVAFGDAGQVYISDSDLSHEFHTRYSRLPGIFEGFRYSYGPGLRLAIGEALVARLDVGFSNEETGLVYLVFGHTF